MTASADAASPRLDASSLLSGTQAQALVRLIEASPQVQRRSHFFVWMQTHLDVLMPHVLAVCGAYQRQRREVVFDAFHSVALDDDVLRAFTDPGAPLMTALTQAWVAGDGRALVLPLTEPVPALPSGGTDRLRRAGLEQLAAHGVSRPQRPAEIETFFVIANQAGGNPALAAGHLELLLPHLHSTYLRMLSIEREMTAAPRASAAPSDARLLQITAREREILQWVREGRSNPQIGEALGISPLTVKNHIQKILRKLGASNRAQAVAMTMSMGNALQRRTDGVSRKDHLER